AAAGAGLAGGTRLAAGPHWSAPAAVEPAARAGTGRGAAGALAEAAVALGAHQCGLRAAAGARPAVGTAGVAAAAGLRAAGAAVRQCPDRAGAAVSDRPSDPSGIGRAARRTRPAVSLRRSRLRPGQRTAAAGAGLSAGAVPRGGDGA